MNKYLLLAVGGISMVSAMNLVHADEIASVTNSNTTITGSTITGSTTSTRLEFKEKARLLREKNKALHTANKDERKEFKVENKDAIKANFKSLTEAQKAEIKKLHDERKAYVESLKDLTPEERATKLAELEAKIKAEIEAKYQNSTGALSEKRMAVYEQNALRRAEMVANQLEIRASRGALRVTEIDAMITKITAELPNLSTEKKTKLAKKIDEKIVKIQANKRLPESTKIEIVAKLTALRNEVIK